ncbi:MAG: sulfite exporter TauE/SafE family protein [Bdellovibrionaceae bacterium]|nr:sulfite exporter TauE/SafE family protein [Pseudobdellovibrionaceae bacterium]
MNDQGLFALGLGLFTTGFLGSWHCAAMCGPIACLAQTRGQLVAYQFGRITSYTMAGALAGALGRTLFHHPVWWVRAASFTLLLGIVLFLSLHLVLTLLSSLKKSPHDSGSSDKPGRFEPSKKPSHLRIPGFNKLINFAFLFNYSFQRLQKYGARSGFGLGFLSILLPCAWLYTFAAGAAATQSGWAGALIMFFFAVSAIPALSVAPHFFARALKGSPLKQKTLSLAVLTFAAIYALAAHFISS